MSIMLLNAACTVLTRKRKIKPTLSQLRQSYIAANCDNSKQCFIKQGACQQLRTTLVLLQVGLDVETSAVCIAVL